jgi:4-hydroxybenzoate polyprenyltransferase
VRAYLELIRVFLTPTAVADSFAGLVVARSLCAAGALPLRPDPGGASDGSELPRVLLLASTSILLYWLGMAANDVFDLEKDRTLAPARPIPSGKVSRSGATVLCIALGALALTLAASLGVLEMAGGVLAAVVAYDAGGKRVPLLGNLLMGACRGGNVLLGAAVVVGPATAVRSHDLVLAGAVLAVYVAGVTAVSQLEERVASPRNLLRASLSSLLVPLLFLVLRPDVPLNWVNSGILALLVGFALRSAWVAARSPETASRAASVLVHRALGGLYFVDAGLVLAFSPPGVELGGAVLTLYALYAIGWLWKRRWAAGGGEPS